MNGTGNNDIACPAPDWESIGQSESRPTKNDVDKVRHPSSVLKTELGGALDRKYVCTHRSFMFLLFSLSIQAAFARALNFSDHKMYYSYLLQDVS